MPQVTFFTLVTYIIFSSIQTCQTKQTIKTASEQNNFTQQEMRAYMVLGNFKIDTLLPSGKFFYSMDMINAGKTPAYNICRRDHYKLVDSVPISDIDIQMFPFSRKKTPKEIVGSESITHVIIESEYHLTREYRIEIAMKKRFLYIYGEISYSDIFQNEHITSYCKYVDLITGIISTYEKYNDAN